MRRGFGLIGLVGTAILLTIVGVMAYNVGWSDGLATHVPAGTALLADLRELCLFMRDTIRIGIATQGNPTGAEYDLFESNAFVIRTEVPVGVGVLRPQAFAVISLPGGS
jgi:hypothetical protein